MKSIMVNFDNIYLRDDQYCAKCAIKLNAVNIQLCGYNESSLKDLDLWSASKLIQYKQKFEFVCIDCRNNFLTDSRQKAVLKKEVEKLDLLKTQLEKDLQSIKAQIKEQENLAEFATKMNMPLVVEHLTVFKNLAERFEEVWSKETQDQSEAQQLIQKLKSPFEAEPTIYNQSCKNILISCLDKFDKFVESNIQVCQERFQKLEEVQNKLKHTFLNYIESGILNEMIIKKIIEEHIVESGIQGKKELQQRSKLIREQIEQSLN